MHVSDINNLALNARQAQINRNVQFRVSALARIHFSFPKRFAPAGGDAIDEPVRIFSTYTQLKYNYYQMGHLRKKKIYTLRAPVMDYLKHFLITHFSNER